MVLDMIKTEMRTQLQTSPPQKFENVATIDRYITSATSKLDSSLLRQSSYTGYVSLNSIAMMRLIANKIIKNTMQSTI